VDRSERTEGFPWLQGGLGALEQSVFHIAGPEGAPHSGRATHWCTRGVNRGQADSTTNQIACAALALNAVPPNRRLKLTGPYSRTEKVGRLVNSLIRSLIHGAAGEEWPAA
jgi:hypothetical protein